MLYLAVDQSTSCGSLAVMRGTELTVERSWDDNAGANQALARELTALQTAGSLDLARVDCFVLGVGPGAYSGLRSAIALVTACALPGRQRLYALSSAEALAWQLAPRYNGRTIMVVGDARRGHLWYRVFRSRGLAPLIPETGWELCAPDALPWRPGLVAVTSDWPRLGALLQAAAPGQAELIQSAVYPTAATLARLAAMRLADAVASEPVRPIYLHAPVKTPVKNT